MKIALLTTIAALSIAAPAQAFNVDAIAGMEGAADRIPAASSAKGLTMTEAEEITFQVRQKDEFAGLGRLAECVRGSKRVIRCSYEDWGYDGRLACVGRVTVRLPLRGLVRKSSSLRCRAVEGAPEWTGLS